VNCVSATSGAVAGFVAALPTISRSGGAASQSVDQNTAISAITYTASNASSISRGGNLPAGVTGSISGTTLTISGTPSATGTFGYTVTTANSNGCAATASGTITVKKPISTSTGGPNTAYSTTTWIIETQTWSDRIVGAPSGCTKSDDLGSSYSAALYRVYDGRYYYTWPCVYNNRSTLCPSPWRVPTQSDFSTLVSNTDYSTVISAWGYGGLAIGSFMDVVNWYAYYWSSTEFSSIIAYRLGYNRGGYLDVYGVNKYIGLQVRCVK
jgi:hypothetical protein